MVMDIAASVQVRFRKWVSLFLASLTTQFAADKGFKTRTALIRVILLQETRYIFEYSCQVIS